MYYAIEASTDNPTVAFVVNGLEYQKDVYTIEYGSLEETSGTPEDVTVGIINKYSGATIVPASPYWQYTNGTTAFTSLSSLITHIFANILS